jgi:cytochrome c oxidase assembly factor CtaG
MALTKEIVVDQITITENGTVLVREATRIMEDGKELSKTYHRSSFVPASDVSAQPQNVQDICNVAWTTEIVSAYQTMMDAQTKKLTNQQAQQEAQQTQNVLPQE